MKGFTKKQVSEITGLTPRLVQYYTEEGLVYPGIDPGGGRGSVRRYSKSNILQFLILKQLSDHGMTLTKVKVLLAYLEVALMEAVSFSSLDEWRFSSPERPLKDEELRKALLAMHRKLDDEYQSIESGRNTIDNFWEKYPGGFKGLFLHVYQTISDRIGFNVTSVDPDKWASYKDVFFVPAPQGINFASIFTINLGSLSEKIRDL